MSIPAKVLPDDEAIRPLDGSPLDGWSLIVWLDPAKSWSASTFTVDGTAAFSVDATHKADNPKPFIIVSLSPADLRAVEARWQHWNLTEDTVLRRTFLTQRVQVVDR